MLLAAGLDGIQNKLEPGAKNTRNLYTVSEDTLRADGIEFLPTTLKDAVDHFELDTVLQEALGQELSNMIIRVKRDEWNAFHSTISMLGSFNKSCRVVELAFGVPALRGSARWRNGSAIQSIKSAL